MHSRKRKWLSFGIFGLLSLMIMPRTGAGIAAVFDTEYTGSIILAEEEVSLSHEEIIKLTDQFMETLLQETDAQQKVINYQNKEALLEAFAPIAAKEAAAPYVDYYYQNEADGLYQIPTETPPWFDKDNDYDMVKLNEHKVQVKQANYSDLHGNYQVTYEFTADAHQEWKLTKITHV